MPYYENYLTNPDAETGNTNGWATSNVSVVPGGLSGGSYCFRLGGAGASLVQTITPGTNAEAVKVSFGIYTVEDLDVEQVLAAIRVVVQQTTLTKKMWMPLVSPITEAVKGFVDDIEVTWLYTTAILPIELGEPIASIQIALYLSGLNHYVYIDDFYTSIDEAEIGLLKEGESYFGVTIGKVDGLTIERLDGLGKVILNSDEFSFYAKVAEEMIQRLYFDPVSGEYLFRGTLLIENDDGSEQVMINEHGMDTKYIKHFKNLVYNSSFENYNPTSGIPDYWTGGIVSDDSSFFETRSMSLSYYLDPFNSYSSTTQGYVINPQWYAYEGVTHTRISFYRNRGLINVEVYDETMVEENRFMLYDNEGNSGQVLTAPATDGWLDSRYTFNFAHGNATAVYIKFTNISTTEIAYIDAVQLEPDITGYWPSFYTNGPMSEGYRIDEVVKITFNVEGMDVEYSDEQIHNWDFDYDNQNRVIWMRNMSTNRQIQVVWDGV